MDEIIKIKDGGDKHHHDHCPIINGN